MYVRSKAKVVGRNILQNKLSTNKSGSFTGRWDPGFKFLPAVPTLLAAFKWRAQSNRYQRVTRFVDYLFYRIDRPQAPGFDPKWKSINLCCDRSRT
jgi:hypothetical protein